MVSKAKKDPARLTMTIGHPDSNVQALTSGVVAGTSGEHTNNVLDCYTC